MAFSSNNTAIHVKHTKSGAQCIIYPFGAHLTSYKTPSGKELLFLSRDAILDGTKAIRGGIPLCFPQFGQPDKRMPQHGFLRNNYWAVVPDSVFDDEANAGISMQLELKDVVNARGGEWDMDSTLNVKCTYTVKIDGNGFTTTIVIENLGEKSWSFQVLLHNYFLVHNHMALNGKLCHVSGLEGYSVDDRISRTKYVLGPEPVVIPEDIVIDRVYDPPTDVIDLHVRVTAGGASNVLILTASGEVNGEKVPVSGVVWNPHKVNAMAMPDFGDDQYNDMICVEPGLLQNVPLVHAGKKASFTQVVNYFE